MAILYQFTSILQVLPTGNVTFLTASRMERPMWTEILRRYRTLAAILQLIAQQRCSRGGIMASALKVSASELDHRIGQLNAPVVLVEYGDYECPYTRVSYRMIDRLLEEFENDLCFIFRHFTMNNIHPHAEQAALAAEAAALQNRFWEMHHLLLATDKEISPPTITLLGQSIGLDMEQFTKDLQRGDLLERIHRDIKGGLKSGVESSPTFFINGYRFEESSSYEPMREAIVGLLDIGLSAYH